MRQLAYPSISVPYAGYPKTSQDFAEQILGSYGAAVVWPLLDITSGTTIPAYNNATFNGTLTGWTLQDTPSPISSETGRPPYSDGTSDKGELAFATMNTIFNINAGGVMIFAKVLNAAVYADGVSRRLFAFRTSGGANAVDIAKTATGYFGRYRANSVSVSPTVAATPTDWFSISVTWNKAADRVRLIFNGALAQELGGLQVWSVAGPLNQNPCILAEQPTPTLIWNGWGCFMSLWTNEPSIDTINAIHRTGLGY